MVNGSCTKLRGAACAVFQKEIKMSIELVLADPQPVLLAGLSQVFQACPEFVVKACASTGDDALAAVQRQMRVAMARETEKLEGGLSLLATIGSTSPYVGLFGTVWGIVNAFVAIGNVKQATLASVAPGIAEALIATAIGLFAAIPAVIAYNRFSHRVNQLEARLQRFADRFHASLSRELEV